MQTSRNDITPTKIKLSIVAAEQELQQIKHHVLEHFARTTKLPGFRSGKAPLPIVEKHVDQNALQAQFIDEAINRLYQKAIASEGVRMVGSPIINLVKFVPYSTLEFEAEVEVLGNVTLADYKKIKKSPEKITVTAKDVEDVLGSLRLRSADKKAVTRAAQSGDELVIDFTGKDQKGNDINGAEGTDYPLILGSKTFIPGFENNLIGLKAGQEKTFTLTFPKDYGVKVLANKKVTFTVTVKNVHKVTEPNVDDAFAAKVGPFSSVQELKDDIKRQLQLEKQSQADRTFENELIQAIVDKSKVELPETLIQEQIERLKGEVRQNLAYRGQTWQEMLKAEGCTEDEYIREQLKPEAERRVKTGLVLAEISVQEQLEVTPEELEIRMQTLKSQYTDQMMQAELNKPEARHDIASRMMTEKTVQHLVDLAKNN
jgi:trigger factor